jgi:hypothetical protein
MPYVTPSYASTLAKKSLRVVPTTSTLLQAKRSLPGSYAEGHGNTSSSQSSAIRQTSMKFPTSQASSANHQATQRSFMLQNAKASQQSGQFITDFELPVRGRLSVGGKPSEQQSSFSATNYSNQSCNTTTPESVLSPDDTDADTKNGEVSQHEGAPTSAPGDSLRRPHLPPSEIPVSPRKPEPITLTEEEYDEYSRKTFRDDRIAWGS